MLEYPVVTPENVRFHYTLAGPGSRLLALLIDTGLLLAASLALSAVLSLGVTYLGDYAVAVYGLANGALFLGGFIAAELLGNGQTPGKRLLRLRVVADQGLRLEPPQVVLRNVLRLVDLLPGFFGLGGLVALLHPEHKRLGDLAAGTLVIRERRVPPPERLHDALDRALSKRASPPTSLAAARLRARALPAEEQGLLQELVLLRDGLEPAVRLRLFRAVAARYRALFELEPEPGQSDERFVLDLADLVLGR